MENKTKSNINYLTHRVCTCNSRLRLLVRYIGTFEITGDPCNLIGSQQYNLLTNHTMFCSQSYSKSQHFCSNLHHRCSVPHHFCSETKMEYDVKAFLLPLPSTRKSKKIAETKIRYQLRKGALGSPKSSHITYHLDVCVIRYVWYRDRVVII